MLISGKAIKFGDNINTDVILPGKYMVVIDPEELGRHAMEGLDPSFPERAREGVILVAGKNFGCGSSREQAPLALKYAGVKGILAESFARIFYRNAINIGLPITEYQKTSERINEGNTILINLRTGLVTNQSNKTTFPTAKLPTFILEILSDGGIIEHLRKRMKDQ
jgi:3-isopropylmalate/(R)-2-methylmalate dehydratase small subunit